MPKPKRNTVKEEGRKAFCDDDLQMRASEGLSSIVTTEIHDGQKTCKVIVI